MRLLILRHGEAVNAAKVGGRDEDRHLTTTGRRTVRQVGRALKAWGICPEAVWTSGWRRALESAEIVAGEAGCPEKPRVEHALEGPPDTAPIMARLAKAKGPGCLMLVGHNPTLEDLVSQLLGAADRPAVKLKKAGLAAVEIVPPVGPGRGILRGLWSPAEIEALAAR